MVLYSDFNCPFCYALEERLHRLALSAEVEWRGVEHAPHLPVPMTVTPGLSLELRWEVQQVRQLAPEVPVAVPPGKPNTRRAIDLLAAAFAHHTDKAVRLKRNLYQALWCHGQDLSDRNVLAALAEEAGLAGLPEAAGTTQTWQLAWMRTAAGGIPALDTRKGRLLTGLRPAEQLRAFFAREEESGTTKKEGREP